MWKRRDFKEVVGQYSSKKEKVKLYAKDNPRKVIAAMFLILLISVTALLISRLFNRKGYGASIDRIFSEVDSGNQQVQLRKKSTTAELVELYQLKGKLNHINPDSIMTKDSLLLREIESDLNNIIDEKD
ncbi:hypothetical protein [Rufibacter sp. XAAS-G3-1]|uniref:hypothetical protein n=1 Tax=Rufibacter sp. XAAS-G3-1 TaxID=2729134 RepID=UPI0015E7B5CC|nr:hypothetical protein [Rufibacter sp. XAAS-G3-1]